MPQTNEEEYTYEEHDRYTAAYDMLSEIIASTKPDAEKFHSALDEALASGFPIDYAPYASGCTLLHEAVHHPATVHAGLPQVLLEAGADVNKQNIFGETLLDLACRDYIVFGSWNFLDVIDILFTGRQDARPELSGRWKKMNWKDPDQRARRDRLDAYIKTWQARGRAGDAAPDFDYAL